MDHLEVDAGVSRGEHAKDLVREGLSDGFDFREVKYNRTEELDSRQYTLGL